MIGSVVWCAHTLLAGWASKLTLLLLAHLSLWGSALGLAPPPSAGTVRLVAVGDIVFGRYLRRPDRHARVYARVSGATDPFSSAAPWLRRADLAFANLETPIMDEPDHFSTSGTLTFRADPDMAVLLAKAGFNVLSLANNHMMNLGGRGATETQRYLLQQSIQPIGGARTAEGALRPRLLLVNGLRICVLAYSLWNNGRPASTSLGAVAYVGHRDFKRIPRDIEEARRVLQPDFLIVSLHWGVENMGKPTERQRRFASTIEQAGADVILGHHPHVLQPFEYRRGKLVAYSLGNFLFDNPRQSMRESVILQITLTKNGAARTITDASLVPILADGRTHVPHPARGADYRRLAQKLRRLAPELRLEPEPLDPHDPEKTQVSLRR